MKNGRSEGGDLPALGVFFTPPRWARWVVEKYSIHQAWADGAVVLDPAAGEGALLEALVQVALDHDLPVTGEMLARLYGVEVQPGLLGRLQQRLDDHHGLTIPADNLMDADFLRQDVMVQADVLLGNPPWINFVDLPQDYKEVARPLFLEYGLVQSRRSVLLGNSRVDLAALFICRALFENLRRDGRAFFYMPLSMLLNDGAHDAFRGYQVKGTRFCLDEVYDFADEQVFEGVSTRYCLAAFTRDQAQRFPLTYHTREAGRRRWQEGRASPPAQDPRGPLLVTDTTDESGPVDSEPLITVPRRSQPRQGVNTCGANGVYIFEQKTAVDPDVARVTSQDGGTVELPAKLLFPLLGPEQFVEQDAPPRRFVLLPHDHVTGKPLTEEQLRRHPLAWDYLNQRRDRLCQRRGVMINSWIRRGRWWALLGVGPYSFAPFKVLWQAYGKRTFWPRLFTCAGALPWQANQAMHAFMPFWREGDALEVMAGLRRPAMEQILLRQRMAGTCNWAQPGRIKRLLQIVD